jgi:shikimate dehydrogenase
MMNQSAYLLGLIGYPLEHSRSPALHLAALRSLGLTGNYLLFPIPPLPEGEVELWELIQRLRAGELDGLNVTIPHKRSVLPWMDELSPAARAIGAVNTILRAGERLVGENTDADGFLADLRRHPPLPLGEGRGEGEAEHPTPSPSPLATLVERGENPPLPLGEGRGEGDAEHPTPSPSPLAALVERGEALVLGAGGSARAVVYALLSAGFSVTVAARRIQQVQELQAHFSSLRGMEISISGRLRGAQLDAASLLQFVEDPEKPIGLIVNCTPVGMAPHLQASPWPVGLPFPEHAAIYDLIYNPSETLLMRQARSAGLPAANGLGMLVEQAALSFEMWTGFVAPRQAMVATLQDQEPNQEVG